MKGKAATILAGLSLVGGMAVAALQEQSTQEQYDPESSMNQEERQDRTGMSTDTQSQYGTESQSESGTQTEDEYGRQTQQGEYDTRSQTTDPYGDEEARTGEQRTSDPEMGTQPESETTYGAEVGEQGMHDLSRMSAEELSGKSVMTAEGEEVGTIEQVGYSSMHQDKVAAVNVGGFLGVGEKVIAIPLSDLQMSSSGEGLETTMSRDEIQSAEEFDPTNLSTSEQPQQYEHEQQQEQPWEQQQQPQPYDQQQ